jgi:hypothetical protein
MIVTHMYLPSMWDKAKPNALHSQITNFDSFEEWYRSELRGRMVQTLMHVSIQSLHVILQDIDMQDIKAVQDAMVLFRWTATCVLKSSTTTLGTKRRYQDNMTASGPNDIARVMKKVMGVEDSKWRGAVTAQTINAKTHVGERVPEMSAHANEVQIDFSESLMFSTSTHVTTKKPFQDVVIVGTLTARVCLCVSIGGGV